MMCLLQKTARLGASRTHGQMPCRDRDLLGQAGSISANPRDFGRRVKVAGFYGVAVAPGFRPNVFSMIGSRPAMSTRLPGVSLLFCSKAEIDAAPTAEREAYYAIVDGIATDPAAFGLREETGDDLSKEYAADRRAFAQEQEW